MLPRIEYVNTLVYDGVPLVRNPVSGYQEALVGLHEPVLLRYVGDPRNPREDPDDSAVIAFACRVSNIPEYATDTYAEVFRRLPAIDRLKWRDFASLHWLLTNLHATYPLVS